MTNQQAARECGVIFIQFGPPRDPHGCVLPDGHEGPHEFICDMGTRYHWETDWSCDCDHCKQCNGDYCMTYWEARPTPPDSGERNT